MTGFRRQAAHPVTLDPALTVPVRYEHSADLPALLERLGVSLVLSTYQAGRLVSVGSHGGCLSLSFSRFDQAMGVCRTPTGLAVGCRQAIWSLPANRELATRLCADPPHDIAFLARTSHLTGPVMVHDLAWAGEQLWLVNTLFNCLATCSSPWSFVPRWKPPFVGMVGPGDHCHLNGLAIAEDGGAPLWATALAETDTPNGWREHKAHGGCLIHVPTGELALRGLAMPHSPRLYQGRLLLLNSGEGRLLGLESGSREPFILATLPGFTRGLDCFAGHAFIGLSRIRETAVFGDLPVRSRGQELRCGLAIIELATGELAGFLWFHSGVEEIFSVCVLPGWRNPGLLGPDTQTDQTQTVWLVPPATL